MPAPNVSQEPRPIADTSIPLSPSCRYRTRPDCYEAVAVAVGTDPYSDPVAKPALKYACAECGYVSGRWFGKCPGCDTFGSLLEEAAAIAGPAARPLLRLVDVEVEEA